MPPSDSPPTPPSSVSPPSEEAIGAGEISDFTGKVWTCNACAFTFDAMHLNTSGTYVCPCCAEARLESQLSTALRDMERWRDEAVVATSNVVVADKERDAALARAEAAEAEAERFRTVLTTIAAFRDCPTQTDVSSLAYVAERSLARAALSAEVKP